MIIFYFKRLSPAYHFRFFSLNRPPNQNITLWFNRNKSQFKTLIVIVFSWIGVDIFYNLHD